MSVTRIDDKVYPTRPHLKTTSLKTMSATEREVHEKTAELLGQVFFAPILAEMRESPFKSELTTGGRGGEAYGGMMDALLIRQVVPPNGHLVKRFANNTLRHVAARERAQELLGLKKEGENVDVAG